MRIVIISNYRNEYDTTFSVTDEIVPCVGDEVIWAYEVNGHKGRLRGTVKRRTVDYTIVPTRTDRQRITLELKDVNPVFNVPEET